LRPMQNEKWSMQNEGRDQHINNEDPFCIFHFALTIFH
jgi:hypothetical protein